VAEFPAKGISLALFFCQNNLYELLNVLLSFVAALIPMENTTEGGLAMGSLAA